MQIPKNGTNYIKRDLTARLLSLFFEDKLEEEIDTIAIKMFPKSQESLRCCIYKDRAAIRYRILALLGISIEKEDDELRSLSSFLTQSQERTELDEQVLTFLDMACSACDGGNYIVTELCRGCVARPCITNCPKDCVEMVNGKAHIDNEACIQCGKCEVVCPYNSIVHYPIPCETPCPVDAIHRNHETGIEEIDYDKCIYCGKCVQSCPFGAVMERSQIIDVALHLKEQTKKTIVMIAPSIIGQYPGSMLQLITALKALGFDAVYEVANGADKTAQAEAIELKEKLDEGQQFLGTSCCPAYTEAVTKHIPDFQPNVSHTPTPMAFTAKDIRAEHPHAISVFIGPCVAKRVEGIRNDDIDYVLTYEELGSFFIAKQINVENQEEGAFSTDISSAQARKFAVSGGVAATVDAYGKELNIEVKPLIINGLDRRGVKQLQRIGKTGTKGENIVEVMSCEGGCICGPGVISNPKMSTRKLDTYSQESPEVSQ